MGGKKVHQFLMGLDDTLHGIVRTNMLVVDPLPTVNRLYSFNLAGEGEYHHS